VVKIGGATLGNHDTTIEDIVHLQQEGKPLVIVHGGGKVITKWLARRGVPTKMVHGERVTDEVALEVVIAVLAGLVNKEIVASINSLGGQAIGISGVDGPVIQGRIKSEEMGYIGTVVKVNVVPLTTLLQSGYIPVVAPVSLHSIDKPEKASQILNINADVVAGEIAAAIGAERLIFLTDVAGACDQSGEVIPRLSPSQAEELITSGVISGGMIPKVRACLTALATTSTTCIMDGRQPHALLNEIENHGSGTIIQRLSE